MRFVQRALGWGLAIYATMYLLWSGLVIYGLSSGVFSLLFRIVVLAAITTIAARSLRLATRMDIVPYSVSWALVAVALDAVFLVPFSGIALYTQWSVWVGYTFIAIIPLLSFSLVRPSHALHAKTRGMPAGV